METPIVPFEFEGAQVRVIQTDGSPWFIAADVCRVLEIKNSRQAIAKLDDDERGVTTNDTLGGNQQMAIISEPGLYSLVFVSRKQQAKKFKRWVQHEVLPSIRKKGTYQAPGVAVPPDLRDPAALECYFQLAAQTARELGEARKQLAAAQPKVETHDRIIHADGEMPLRAAAKAIKVPEVTYFRKLKERILYYLGGSLVPKQEYVERGYFTVCIHEIRVPPKDGQDEARSKIRHQTFVTPKGLTWLAKIFTNQPPLF